MKTFPSSNRLLFGLGLLAVLSGLAWWQRPALLTWYYVQQLADADEQSLDDLVSRLVALDEAAVPRLVEQLHHEHPLTCANAEVALAALARSWSPEDDRTVRLAERLRDEFDRLSAMGQGSALLVLTAALRQEGSTTLPAPLARTAGELAGTGETKAELRGPSLLLTAALVARSPRGQWLDVCRNLADQGLTDGVAKTRVAAVQLILRSPLQEEKAFLTKLVPLLRDESPLVRRAALVALAPARDLVSEDDLLPLLHDADVEVQQTCEVALRSRGLPEGHLEMARLISDERPAARLKVLERLGYAGDLDPNVWLRRLSQDPSPAVRAAAARAAGQFAQADLTDRLRDMARRDPSETVRQNAEHYLRLRLAKPAADE